jgi:hypothetical protein
MRFNKFLPILLLNTGLLFSGNIIGLNINSEDFEVEGSIDINSFADYTNGTIFVLDANYINTEDSDLFGFGLSASNTFQGLDGLSLGLGARFVNYEDYSAIPFMLEAIYSIPLIDSIPSASFSGAIYYAPSVLSFDDAEDYFEFRAEAAMEVISAVSIYVGYRDIEADNTYKNFTNTFNSSFYGGMKMSF